MAERRSYSGNAILTATLSAGISASDATISISANTGWPDGTVGPAMAVIDPGLSTEEKIKYTTRSGSVLNTVVRGQDGTVAVAHSAGAPIHHVWTASDADIVNKHAADLTVDDHTQYFNSTRHADPVKHAFGDVVPAASSAADLGPTSGGIAASGSHGDHSHGFPVLTTYTPTMASASAGNGSLVGKYMKIGKLMYIHIKFALGSTSSITGLIGFNFPTGTLTAAETFLPCLVNNSAGGGGLVAYAWAPEGAGDFNILTTDGTPGAATILQLASVGIPGAWASGDSISLSGWVPIT